MEMLRKFLLVGLFIVLEPGSILQITIGTIVAAAYLMVQVGFAEVRARIAKCCPYMAGRLVAPTAAQCEAVQAR